MKVEELKEGHRYLLTEKYTNYSLTECLVLEITKEGVKIKNLVSDSIYWETRIQMLDKYPSTRQSIQWRNARTKNPVTIGYSSK